MNAPEARNSNIEIRNKFEIRNPNRQPPVDAFVAALTEARRISSEPISASEIRI
jgi:hypothetical protein